VESFQGPKKLKESLAKFWESTDTSVTRGITMVSATQTSQTMKAISPSLNSGQCHQNSLNRVNHMESIHRNNKVPDFDLVQFFDNWLVFSALSIDRIAS
jgi:hypothetical protein